MDMEAVRYVAAKQGLRGNQKQVAVFNRDPNGPDILWVLRTGSVYTLAEIRTALTRTGVEHRTLVPTRDGTRVEVLDRGTRATEKIKSVATHCGWHIAHHAGWAEFIGAQTREAAQPIYQLIVDDYEEKYGIASAKAPNFDYKARESTRKLSGLHLQLNQVG
jgi:hypothetical protein